MSILRRVLPHLPRSVKDAIIRRAFTLDENALRTLSVRVASTVEEHEAAAALLQDMYVRRGILEPHPSGLRVPVHHVLPSTVVFVARDLARTGQPVVGTMSLVFDSPVGLPMDDVFADVLAPLRAAKRQVAEVGALALAPEIRGTGAMYLLCRAMNEYAALAGCNEQVITVHPNVADYYRANMWFETMGTTRHYPGLTRSALAIPMRRDPSEVSQMGLERFGFDAHDASNPYWLWYLRDAPQIEKPDLTDIGRQRHLEARRKAAAHLVALRPDAILGLDKTQQRHLMKVLPELFINRAPSRTRSGEWSTRITVG